MALFSRHVLAHLSFVSPLGCKLGEGGVSCPTTVVFLAPGTVLGPQRPLGNDRENGRAGEGGAEGAVPAKAQSGDGRGLGVGRQRIHRRAGQPETGLLKTPTLLVLIYNLLTVEQLKSTQMSPNENGHQLTSHLGQQEH